MPIIDALSSLTELQHGLVTTSQARRLLGANATRQLDRSAEWTRVTPTVRRRVGAPQTKGQAALAAVLDAGGDALLSHESAARWWGLTGCPLSARDDHYDEVGQQPNGTGSHTQGHTAAPVVDGQASGNPDSAAGAARTAALLRDPRGSGESARRPPVVDATAVRPIHRGVPGRPRRARSNGTAGLRRYLEPRGADYIPPASGLESRVTAILDRVGIHLRRQIDSGGDRWTGRVDFRHVTLPLIVEVQSEAFHAALCDSDADERRIAELRSRGVRRRRSHRHRCLDRARHRGREGICRPRSLPSSGVDRAVKGRDPHHRTGRSGGGIASPPWRGQWTTTSGAHSSPRGPAPASSAWSGPTGGRSWCRSGSCSRTTA